MGAWGILTGCDRGGTCGEKPRAIDMMINWIDVVYAR